MDLNRKQINPLVSLKNQCDDFGVEFDVLPAVDPNDFKDPRQLEIYRGVSSVDAQLAATQAKIDEINAEIDRLTNHADGVDYTVAVACGLLTGIIDVLWVKEFSFDRANEFGSKKIEDFVKKVAVHEGYTGNDLDGAVSFLEGTNPRFKFVENGKTKHGAKLAADAAADAFGGGSAHHLRDFAHHPTIVGLFFSLLTQFTECFYGTDVSGRFIILRLTDLPPNKQVLAKARIGKTPQEKIFLGTVCWFFHVVSDLAGSSGTISKGGSGTGLPGPILSFLKEMSALPIFKKSSNNDGNKDFSVWISKLYNGTLLGERDSNGKLIRPVKFDFRTEIGIKHEFGRQAVPIMINECLVRSFYFLRRLYLELRNNSINSFQDLEKINWKSTLPFKNRTIVRMMTIASGTFTTVDMADAAIRAAGKSGGTLPGFAAQMVLRVNFVGVGRFAIAVGSDVKMGVQRSRARDERMALYSEMTALTDAKVFYKQADMWIAAENTGETIEQACNVAEAAGAYYMEAMEDISESLAKIGTDIPEVQEKNPGLTDEMLDILEWG